jgi:hypothetical protein
MTFLSELKPFLQSPIHVDIFIILFASLELDLEWNVLNFKKTKYRIHAPYLRIADFMGNFKNDL